LLTAFLLLAFGFQSYIAQTHIHDVSATTPAAIHHLGHSKLPVQNSPLDCSFCQMMTQADSFLIPDALLVLATPEGMTMAAPHYRLAKTSAGAKHDWQSRAPPSN
jgi:hypothetical protein